MPSDRDARRLALGKSVSDNPDASEEDLVEAITAMQSTDDLGSREENTRAWELLLSLERRLRELRGPRAGPPDVGGAG